MTSGCFVALNNFRSNVIGSAANSFPFLVWTLQFSSKTKVAYFDIDISIEKEVTKFEVPMNDTTFVEVKHCVQELSHEECSFGFSKSLSTLNHFV